MASLLQAGIPLAEALRMIIEQAPDKKVESVFRDIREKVTQGMPFGDAVLHPGTTQFYVMVAVIGVALFISIFIARRVFKMARDAAREAAAKESAKGKAPISR